MKKITLVKTNFNHHVSMDLYFEFEKAFLKSPNCLFVDGVNSKQARFLRVINRILPQILIPLKKENRYLVIGYQKEKFFPFFHFNADLKALWMYDAWDYLFDDIEKSIRAYQINFVFFSSKQSAEHFSKLDIPNFEAHWIPEAVDIEQYEYVPYQKRTIDLLQLGRVWGQYHNKIKPIESDVVYKYEESPGQIIFPTRQDFIHGLANSKISICVPSCITHPNRSGSISTMTNRYLQSMASKCLILGKMPYDMTFLFDYNPIVEIDDYDPIGQIKFILKNFDDYIPMIEKNYREVQNFHTWSNRVSQIENTMRYFQK